MLNTQKLVIDHLASKIETVYQQSYGLTEPPFGEMGTWVARLALENIANSDMLYHNMEHTVQVTLVGLTIIQGKHLCEGGVTPRDWFHYVAALLCHDIGYVRGVCRGDQDGEYVTGIGDETIIIPKGGTDAALTPYHVDRSKVFVRERFGPQAIRDIDAERIAGYIEMTRFPVPAGDGYRDTRGYAGLVRAADFVGQLGDPNYLNKTPALFYEFEETGANAKFGYTNPEDLRTGFARFYWNVISPYIQDALRYLYATQEGRQWAANLYSQVFTVEHGVT
ncbi:MAG: metal-dependent phosphohydrolase [Chloroflexi bacterium]|nr:metal-dependent phosphohydrolase [Chloroflexota bacterium]MBU1747227.1 metal-dependent phosphohydrolase [Chloroflexota bacterium]